jgi:hypothetical protein
VLESASAATDLDLISYFKAIPDVRMRRGIRIPAWYFLLVAVLGILSRAQSFLDIKNYPCARHRHLEVRHLISCYPRLSSGTLRAHIL